jgi:hypothetical protein
MVTVNKHQKRVLKQYPAAKLITLDDGTYAVINNEEILASEYFLPPASTVDSAWEYAAIACKTTQNFNRTHPDRMDLTTLESKLSRIQKRKKHAKKT